MKGWTRKTNLPLKQGDCMEMNEHGPRLEVIQKSLLEIHYHGFIPRIDLEF